jgi:DDE family transposase
VTNWAAYDIALRQRGSLTVWFTEAAIAGWKAEPRTTRGGQPRYSALAITTPLTLRAVFRLALRQTEGLIASLLRLLGLDLAAPDHSTISRRGETLPVSRPRPGSEPVHLLVDSTGLKLGGPGEWLVEKHTAKVRRSWRKLQIGVDADTGQIIAAELTSKDVDDGSQVGPLLSRLRARLRRLPATAPMIGTMSTVRSASVIRMRRSLCRHVRARCQAQWQTARRRSATGTCS